MHPQTPLANAVDNMVTLLVRTTLPIPTGAVVMVTAPEGFRFDAGVSDASLPGVTSTSPEPNVAEFLLAKDFVAPNEELRLAIRIQNPSVTPTPNDWSLDIRTRFMEHIDLARYVEGFAIAFASPFVRVIPSVIPWVPGTEQACAVLFVTSSPIFRAADGPDGPIDATWYVVLEAPTGFRFPTENKYTDRCRGFGRYGGWDTYLQLPRAAFAHGDGPRELCRRIHLLQKRSIFLDF